MALSYYDFTFLPLSSLNFHGATPDLQGLGGWGWTSVWNMQISYTADNPITAEVVADAAYPQISDDPIWSFSGIPAHTQALDGDLEIEGVDYPTGAAIEDEYEVTLKDADGNQYVLAAISLTTYRMSQWGYPTDDKTTVVGFVWDGAAPPPGTILTVVSVADGQSLNPNTATICFARGTLIATPSGERRIEDLAADDLVLTRDHGPQPIRWIGAHEVSSRVLRRNEKLRPIRIRAGALGDGLPAADLVVSPQHRVLVRSKVAERMFGAREVLVAAKQLLQVDGIDIAEDLAEVGYYHMLFDRHEIVFSNGAETESLFTGPEALKAVGPEAVEEIFALFPELRDRDYAATAARVLVSGRQGRRLAMRHVQHARPLVA